MLLGGEGPASPQPCPGKLRVGLGEQQAAVEVLLKARQSVCGSISGGDQGEVGIGQLIA